MSHFAKIENGVVTNVIVASQDFIDSGAIGDPSSWKQTSYNTYGNVHYGNDGTPDSGQPLRGNYAGIGFTYDEVNDVFYAPQPYPSWTLNEMSWLWEAPIPKPEDLPGELPKIYDWDEETLSWVDVTPPKDDGVVPVDINE